MEYNQDIAKDRRPVLCWGHKNLPKQAGLVSYSIAPNRVSQSTILWTQGAFSKIFRRSQNQFLYVVPPFVAAYCLMEWARERNEYLNSKEGRRKYADDDG